MPLTSLPKKGEKGRVFDGGFECPFGSPEELSKNTQILSNTSVLRNSSLSSIPSPIPPPPNSFPTSPFLEFCYLCRRRLQEGKDIYMYRGDRAFCSVECQCKQICMDEESGRRDNFSLAAAGAGAPTPHQRGRVMAGGFVY